jgi:hypothetical protein
VNGLSGYAKLLLIAALLIHLLLGILAIRRDNITADEQDHLNYGISVLKGNTGRRDTAQDFTSTMPISVLNALPRAVEQVLHPGLQKNDFGKQDTMMGRYITLAFSLLLVCLIFLFTKEFAPPWVASITSFLAATDPNFLAHGHLVTTDIFASLSFLATIYFLYKWIALDQRKYFFYWCIAIAIAQCCKMNNLILYPISIVIIILFNLTKGSIKVKHIGDLAIFLLIQSLIINCFFLFEGTGTYLSNSNFSSVKISHLVSLLPFDFPIPVPLTYLDGFDRMFLEIESGKGFYRNYLLGELRSGKPFPAYFIVCWNLKTPVLTLLLVYASIILITVRFREYRVPLLFLVFPAMFIILMISFADIQNGYRYAMTITALLFPLTGIIIERIYSKAGYLAFAIPVIAMVNISLWVPNFIPYTNELLLNKTKAYLFLADSNLNWKQNDERVASWIRSHPGTKLDPRVPTNGRILVDINKLTGADPSYNFAWLRDHYKPSGHLWHSHLIYNVK